MTLLTKIGRGILILFAILFLWAASLQINDPDPFFWIAIYVMAAFLCIYYGIVKEPRFRKWIGILTVVFSVQCLVYGLVLWKGFAPGWTDDEQMRESLGLIVVAIVCICPPLFDFKQSRTSRIR